MLSLDRLRLGTKLLLLSSTGLLASALLAAVGGYGLHDASQTEKFLAENSDKIPADKKTELTEALGELRSALGGSDLEAIKASQEKVAKISQEVGTAMYANSQAATGAAEAGDGPTAGGTTPPPSAAAGSDDVVDAEIVDDENRGGAQK